MVVQKSSRSSQLRSGSPPDVGGGSALPVVTGGGAVQVPPGTIWSLSAQLSLVPPTQAAVPQASTRRSPPLTTVQTQSDFSELHAGRKYAIHASAGAQER